MAMHSAPVFALFFLIAVLITSCKTTYSITLYSKVDTSGNQTPPHFVTNVLLPAGTQITLVSANPASPRLFFKGVLTQEIPANTEFALRMSK